MRGGDAIAVLRAKNAAAAAHENSVEIVANDDSLGMGEDEVIELGGNTMPEIPSEFLEEHSDDESDGDGDGDGDGAVDVDPYPNASIMFAIDSHGIDYVRGMTAEKRASINREFRAQHADARAKYKGLVRDARDAWRKKYPERAIALGEETRQRRAMKQKRSESLAPVEKALKQLQRVRQAWETPKAFPDFQQQFLRALTHAENVATEFIRAKSAAQVVGESAPAAAAPKVVAAPAVAPKAKPKLVRAKALNRVDAMDDAHVAVDATSAQPPVTKPKTPRAKKVGAASPAGAPPPKKRGRKSIADAQIQNDEEEKNVDDEWQELFS